MRFKLPASLSGENSIGARQRRLFSRSLEEHNNLIQDSFRKAKEISDFVGIIVRLAFVLFIMQYFASKTFSSDHWYHRSAMVICFLYSVGLYAVYLSRLSKLMADYFLLDAMKQSGYKMKLFALIYGILTYLVVNYGLWRLATDLATKSKIG